MKATFSPLSFIAGAVIGGLLVVGWYSGGISQSSLTASTSPETSTTTSSSSESTLLTVSDQAAGKSVLVDSIIAPVQGVWIAVRDINGDELGKVLGAARVSGTRSNVTVQLLRATEAGKEYAVELYRDDSNGTFEAGLNSVYIDFDTSAPAIVHFKTTE